MACCLTALNYHLNQYCSVGENFHGSSDIWPMGFIYSIQICEISLQTFEPCHGKCLTFLMIIVNTVLTSHPWSPVEDNFRANVQDVKCTHQWLVQEIRNSSLLAMELRLSCINPSIWKLHIWITATASRGQQVVWLAPMMPLGIMEKRHHGIWSAFIGSDNGL